MHVIGLTSFIIEAMVLEEFLGIHNAHTACIILERAFVLPTLTLPCSHSLEASGIHILYHLDQQRPKMLDKHSGISKVWAFVLVLTIPIVQSLRKYIGQPFLDFKCTYKKILAPHYPLFVTSSRNGW